MTADYTETKDSSSSSNALDRSFLYQNNQTGEASSAPLTTKQLCRLLCPVSALSAPQNLTAETQVLLIESDGSYSTEGWKPVGTLPILKEVVANWYYEEQGSAQGPVSCRKLQELLKEKQISFNTRVYSDESPTWQSIDQLSDLKLALEAFDISLPPQSTGTPSEHEFEATDVAFPKDKDVQDELEAFLLSTDHMGPRHDDAYDDEDMEAYESDSGTRYVKDPRTGNWIHEALAPRPTKKEKMDIKKTTDNSQASSAVADGKKRKKPKFSAKNAKCWVYVTGLPADCTIDEISNVFSKAGIIDLDPESQRPKIKLYRHKDGPNKGECKGDASVCYARPESVDLAITLLDESQFRPSIKSVDEKFIRVERAKFEQHGDKFDDKRGRISNAKRKVAKLAAIQKMDWDEGEYNGRLTGGRKGLRIIVLKNLFDPAVLEEDDEERVLSNLEKDLRSECEQWGTVEKITVFSKHPDGVVVVKFAQPGAASEAVKALDGRMWKEVGRIQASFWDGVTDFTVRDEEKEKKETEKRTEEFGKWLEHQELPQELHLRHED